MPSSAHGRCPPGGISFQATKLPGHTEYHCGRRFEVDGRRVAYVDDTLARALTGPRFGGPIFQNRFQPADFVETVTKIRDFAPEFLLTGHFGVVAVEPAFLHHSNAIATLAITLELPVQFSTSPYRPRSRRPQARHAGSVG